MATDKDIVLNALQRERDELHERIMQVDRIIKRLKSVETIDTGNEIMPSMQVVPIVSDKPKPVTPSKSKNIKLVVLSVFDILGVASRMKDIQTEYEKITDNKYNIREAVRGLYAAKLVRMIKCDGQAAKTFWAKKEWIENGILLDQHKPEGFDLLYKPEFLVIE